ncbi:unnamed protein product [Acidithrix sp. C25]|nr:unnamed protein product [Acidithrix sp. C25]
MSIGSPLPMEKAFGSGRYRHKGLFIMCNKVAKSLALR